jgi:hypothetical protein
MANIVLKDFSTNVTGPSTSSSCVVQQTTRAESECKICGVSARYSYYGAIVCQSCKIFFRRNAKTGQVN